MFRKKSARPSPAFDKTGKYPVIRSSICTGEQVAGFRDETTGKFHEVMLIRTDVDFQEFLRLYDVPEGSVKREY